MLYTYWNPDLKTGLFADDNKKYLSTDLMNKEPIKDDFISKDIKLLDTGDFIEATGKVGKSQTGEISVFSNFVKLLTKSLRPLPEKFTNKEERYRRRYVDMNVNPEVRERLVRRSKFWQATRDFMNKHGFIEVNIPVLEHTTGGADATPFTTHMNALDEDFYLRISHELPLKRLLGGGFEKVYDIGPRFRNEGVDDEHLPEHIAFESYAAYENYEDYYTFPVGEFKGEDLFMLRVDGTSMIDAGIMDGDKIIVRRQQTAENGEIVVALVEDSATVKRFFRRDGQIVLHPENEALSDMIFEPGQVSILGKVVGLIRNYRS